ncbi:MAG: zinc ribbon domain-containing protein [Thermaerobacter sp.]|nr:zinc ribbon domain-containing protein [Thermaerobacter sp.]
MAAAAGVATVFLLLSLSITVAAVWVSVHLGNKKGMVALGWILGIFLGWIGVVIMLVIPASAEAQRREALEHGFACPYCQEPVRDGATVCPHCRRDLRAGGN